MALQPDELEAMLAENVRAYLADYKTSEQLEAQRLQELCETLNWFFLAIVREHERWNRYHSVDGVVALSVEVRSANELALDGYIFVFGEKRTRGFMMEPFSATLRIVQAGDRLRRYRIQCGDVSRPFATVPYSMSRSPRMKMVPEDWLFTLEKN